MRMPKLFFALVLAALVTLIATRADAQGLPSWLETATPENVPLYQRLGFAIQCEWDVAKGGPHFWGMMRAAV